MTDPTSPALRAEALEQLLTERGLVRTDEVAHAIYFLSSEDASGITGVNLPVDAGWLVTPSWHTYGGIRDKR